MSALDQVVSQPRIERASRIAWLSFLSACLAWMFDAMDLTPFELTLKNGKSLSDGYHGGDYTHVYQNR